MKMNKYKMNVYKSIIYLKPIRFAKFNMAHDY